MNKKNNFPKGRYIATVKIGPKGQIIIPKQARDIIGAVPGDYLMLLAAEGKGIALNKADYLYNIAEEIMSKNNPGTDDKNFVEAIKNAKEDNDDDECD